MNRFYHLVIALSCITVGSCNKQNQSQQTQQANENLLPGVWELRAVSGGWLPPDSIDARPGNGNLWKFAKTDFQRVIRDSVYSSGTYSISWGTGTDLNTGRTIDQFVFNNQLAESFELNHDTLKVYYGLIAADGDIQMFVKIAETQ